jgi:hypothetical protein
VVSGFRTALRRDRRRPRRCCPILMPDSGLLGRALGVFPAQNHPPGGTSVASQWPQPNPRQADFSSIGAMRTPNVCAAACRTALSRE